MGISYNCQTNMITLECGSRITFDEWVRLEKPTRLDPDPEREAMRTFFFGMKLSASQLADEWRAQGRCPLCGQLGRIHLSTMICTTHGAY